MRRNYTLIPSTPVMFGVLSLLVVALATTGTVHAQDHRGGVDRVPYATAFDGGYAVVGAPWQDGYRGAAYVLARDGNEWRVEQKLTPADLRLHDHFGGSVAISGDCVVVGTTWQNTFRGAAYVFRRVGGEWIEVQKLTARDATADQQFGMTVAIDGATIAVGAARSDTGAGDSGATYRFERTGDRWEDAGKLTSQEPGAAPDAEMADDILEVTSLISQRDGAPPVIHSSAAQDTIGWVNASDGTREDRVEVTWDNIGRDDIVYKVSRNGSLLSVASSDDDYYWDETGTLGVTYTYCVVIKYLTEPESDPVCDDGSRIVFAPSSVTASDGQYTDRVGINWVDLSTINDGYHVYRDSFLVDTLGPNETSFNDTGAVPDSIHSYAVAAFVLSGGHEYESAWTTDSGWRGLILPPLSVSASDGEYSDRVVITWQDQAPDEVGYRIYRDSVLIASTGVDTDTYEDTSAAFGVAYTYCVTAEGTGGIESIWVCDTGRAGLTAPGNVSASDATFDDKIQITWDDLSNSEDGYEITRVSPSARDRIPDSGKPERRPAMERAAASVVLDTTTADAVSYDDFSAAAGITYTYYVRAVSNQGGYSTSGSDDGYRSFVLAPFNVQASDGEYEDRTSVTWESASTTAVLFMIFRDGTFIKSVNESQKYFNDHGGVAGQDYDYSVVAVTAVDSASASASDTGRRELKSPVPVEATDDEYEDRVIVSWTDNSSVEDGYRIYRKGVDDSVSVLIATTKPNRSSFVDYYGRSAVTYVYSAAAYDTTDDGTTGESAVGTNEGRRLLFAPSGVSATDGTYEDRVEITWNDNSNAEDGYYVYRDSALIDSTADNFTSYVDHEPILGELHEYRIAAFDAIGASESSSDTGSVDILAPVSVNASDFYEHKIELTWIDRSNIEDGYLIYRDGEPVDTLTESEGYSYLDQSELLGTASCVIPGTAENVTVQGNYAYVVQSQVALHVVDISDPTTPTLVGSCSIPPPSISAGCGVSASGNYVYITNYDAGLEVFDVSDPANPFHTGHYAAGSDYYVDVFVVEPYAYVLSEFTPKIVVLDVTDPTNPTYVLDHGTMGYGRSIFVSTPNLCVTTDSGLETYFAFGGTILVKGSYSTSGAGDLFVSGDSAYVVTDSGLEVLDINPANPTLVGSVPGISGNVTVSGSYAYVVGSGLSLVDISDPSVPILLGDIQLPGYGYDVDHAGGYTFIADGTAGLQVASGFYVLPEGVPYDYCVQAYSGDIESSQICDQGAAQAGTIVPGISGTVEATDGTEDSRIRVTWSDTYTGEFGYLIYRDGVLYDENVGPNLESYNDTEARRGLTYSYCVRVVVGPDTLDVGCDFGWRPPNGAIAGRVTTRGGGGVEGISVTVNPSLTSAVLCDGQAGAVRVEDSDAFNFSSSSDFTIEAWVRYTGKGATGGTNESIVSKGVTSGSYPFELRTDGLSGYPGRLVVAVSDGVQSVTVASASDSFNDDDWHHIACAHNAATEELSLYVDGEFNSSASTSALGDITNGDDLLIGSGRSGAYHGQVDEVRIWNVARTDAQISGAWGRPLQGDEAGLLGYWRFDEGGGWVATDMAGDAQYGVLEAGAYWTEDVAPIDVSAKTDVEGNYVISDLRFEDGDSLSVRPHEGQRQFQPAFKTVVLSEHSPVANDVGFVDITSYTISGQILFAGTNCPVSGAQILVDGYAMGTTDKNGKFAVSSDNGEHTVSVELGDNTFEPDEITMLVAGDTTVTFTGTTVRTLSGSVGGGCGRYVGDVTITIESQNGCLQTTLPADSASASYAISLPPQVYQVSATVDDETIPSGLNEQDVTTFFQRLGVREVDLTEEPDTLDFIYRANLIVAITGLKPYVTCGQLMLDGQPLPDSLPVIPQLDVVELTIEVNESYGPGETCPLDTGTVVIYDEIFDREDTPVVLPVSNGKAEYVTVATTPSLGIGRMVDGKNRSYQKAITARAVVEGKDPVSATEWVLVTGHLAPEGTEFVTFTSDPMPLYILRDPPGDGSYAYLEEGFSKRSTIVWDQHSWSATLGANLEMAWGLNTEFFYGLGAGKIDKAQAQVVTKGKFRLGLISYEEGKTEQIVSTTERYATSSSDLFIGDKGDVFVGSGFNFLFAEVDVVDVEGCDVVRSVDIGFQPDGIATEFVFTEHHIESVLIPELEQKVDHYTSNEDPDSAEIFQDQVNNWQDWLEWNREMKYSSESYENRSFSAGADFQYTTRIDTVESFTKTTKMRAAGERYVGMLFKLFGAKTDLSTGFEFTDEKLYGYENWTETESHTVGYVLSDDDIGDNFTVDIKRDGRYRSPIFDVLGGVSSCPWEAWRDSSGVAKMTPRDGAGLSIDPVTATGIPPDQPAVFDLWLTNESASDEARWLTLQVVSTSNPDGAIIRADGAFINSGGISYFLEPYQDQHVTLTVQRGPTRYSYDNLQVMLYPPCEFANWQKHGEMQRAAFKTFNVEFEAPCSEITLYGPEDGWTFDKADQDAGGAVSLVLTDYDIDIGEIDEGLTVQYVGFQYRHLGEGDEGPAEWSTVEFHDSLGTVRTLIDWQPPDSLEDGAYELRAFTYCASGEGYSPSVHGTIDRHAPVVLGTPEPSDGVLSFGEDISITFNETIDCESIDPDSVRLTYLDGPDADSLIACETSCDGRTIVITPTDSSAALEGRRIEARVSGIRDRIGNPMEGTAAWEFDYRRSLLAWGVGEHVSEVAFRHPGSLSAELINGTGMPVDFAITEYPAWITATTPGAGSLLAGETRAIDFTLQEDIEIGCYEGEVRAEATDSTGSVSVAILDISLTVSCQEPDWAVNPGDYEQSMTVVAKLDIDGEFSTDEDDKVAAFAGTELRGVANVDSVQVFDGHTGYDYSFLAFLTIHSNRTDGETIRFQIWCDDSCKVFNSTLESYPFVADGQIGTPDAPVTLTATEVLGDSVLAIPVGEGWNWISTNVLSADMSAGAVLADLTPSPGDLIKSHTAFSQFVDPATGWTPLLTLDNVSAYMLNVSQAGTILHTGALVPVDSLIPVAQGWNWIGYLPDEPIAVNTALADLQAQALANDGDMIKSQDAFAQYLGGTWYGGLDVMEPGKGYKLFLSSLPGDTSFAYPQYVASASSPEVLAAGSGGESLGTDLEAENAPDWSVDPHDYQFNMTATAVLTIDGRESVNSGDMIGAFVGDDCRGVARAVYIDGVKRYVTFLMIHSNESAGEKVSFKAFDAGAGRVLDIKETLACEADAVQGTVLEPVVLTAESTGDESTPAVPTAFALMQNAPNPFNPTTTIRYNVPSSGGDVTIRIYDVEGRLVYTLVDGYQSPGQKTAIWKGRNSRGQSVATGVYFYRMTAPGFAMTRKMVLLK